MLQAYLRRTFDDVRALAELAPSVRLVKGIYIEPPEIAYTEPALVNRNFVALLRDLVDRGCPVAVATHDEALVGEARRLADERRPAAATATSSSCCSASRSRCATS